MFGTSDRDVWIVGHAGVALHWDGRAFTPLATGTETNLNGGFSSGPGDVWIVGDQGLILHYDGSHLVPMDSGVSSNLSTSVGLRGQQGFHLWAVGAPATVLHHLGPGPL